MKPGIYPNLTFDEYRGIDAWNYSALKYALVSPAHARYAKGRETQRTPAQRFGQLVHEALLDPAAFTASAVIGGPINAKTGKPFGRDTQAWAAYEAERPGKVIIDPEEHQAIERIRRAVMACDDARVLLEAAGPVELTIVWTDPETSVLCKGRIDKLAEFGQDRVIADPKTCQAADERSFVRDIVKWKYHVQDALYIRGVEALMGKRPSFRFIAVEVEEPTGVQVHELTDESIQVADAQISVALHRIRACEQEGQWPSYPPGVKRIALPAWAVDGWLDAIEDDQ